jgi:hypothetical protein
MAAVPGASAVLPRSPRETLRSFPNSPFLLHEPFPPSGDQPEALRTFLNLQTLPGRSKVVKRVITS